MAHPIYANELEMDVVPAAKLSITTWSSALTPSNLENPKQKAEFMGKSHTGRVTKAFNPMRIVLLILGRSPFVPLVKKVKSKESSSWGNQVVTVYEPSMKTLHWIYFFFTSFLLAFVLIMSTLGFADHFLSWNFLFSLPWTKKEQKIFQANLVPFVLFWSCLIHSTLGNISFVINRKSIAEYMNDCNVAVDVMNVSVPSSLTKFLLATNMWFLGFLIAILIFYVFRLVPIVYGGSALIGILTFRPFIEIPDKIFWKMEAFGIVTLLYGIYSSRVLLLVFSFMTRLLRHCFKVWNKRLSDELLTSRLDKRSGFATEKMTCEKLYKDHCILTKLVKQTDKAFGTLLQSYYGSQILNMCFELYYLARSGIKGSFGNEDESKMDILASITLLLQNVYFFLTVSLDAAYVGEEAMKGFDVLRSRGLHPDDTIHKKYLIYSLQVSYSQRIVITGGKYFSLDRPFIVTVNLLLLLFLIPLVIVPNVICWAIYRKVLGAVFTYFVIILQFGPSINSPS